MPEVSRFLGIVLDGIVLQRGMGFDGIDPNVVVRLVEDAISGGEPDAQPDPSSSA